MLKTECKISNIIKRKRKNRHIMKEDSKRISVKGTYCFKSFKSENAGNTRKATDAEINLRETLVAVCIYVKNANPIVCSINSN